MRYWAPVRTCGVSRMAGACRGRLRCKWWRNDMANGVVRIGSKTYAAADDTEPDVADINEPAEGELEGEGQKLSQQEANYRMGSPMACCGNCVYYSTTGNTQFGQCSQVAGPISTYGVSDVYQPVQNPFRGGGSPTAYGGQ
jgi:hypothetical protein